MVSACKEVGTEQEFSDCIHLLLLLSHLVVILCNPIDCSTAGLPVPHHLPKFVQVHVHCISDAIQSSHPLTPSSPSALNLSQHQEYFSEETAVHIR